MASRLTDGQTKCLCDLLGNVNLTLRYKASLYKYDAVQFHALCDRQGPTLLVAYNNSGYIFGGYTSVDYTQSQKNIIDDKAFLFSIQGKIPIYFKVNSGQFARCDSTYPNFGQQLYFCYNNKPVLHIQEGKSFIFDSGKLYGNDTALTECEVYKVNQISSYKEKPWRNIEWTYIRRDELMELIRNHKPLVASVSQVRILMIGPVGAGKSTFFNSINSVFTGHVTHKAMSGSAETSVTTLFRTYQVKDGREGKPLPFVLCDTMGLEEQSGAGLDIEDISSILQGHLPDRYKFNPETPFQPDEQKASRSSSLQQKIHCVVYVIEASKISIMSDKLVEKLAVIRKKINSLDIPQMTLMTKVDEACPDVQKDLNKMFVSSYIKSKVQEVSSRVGVPVSCILPVKNYSQELELELYCDILLLTAVQQMLRLADDYLDDVDS